MVSKASAIVAICDIYHLIIDGYYFSRDPAAKITDDNVRAADDHYDHLARAMIAFIRTDAPEDFVVGCVKEWIALIEESSETRRRELKLLQRLQNSPGRERLMAKYNREMDIRKKRWFQDQGVHANT